MSILGLDIGTTGCKAIVINNEGRILSRAIGQYLMIHTQAGWAELDPTDVWKEIKSLFRQVSAEVSNDPIQAISVSAMGDSITPCDQNMHPISNSILAFDTRNIQEAKFFENTLGREWIFQKTGQPVHPTYSITKILWLKNNNPQIFKNADYFLCFEDLITGLLCGEAVFSYSSAARTMAFDINDYSWNEDILEIASIDAKKLAKPMASGTVVGRIQKDLAKEFHFSENVKIIIGGHDQPCGALGCDLFQDGVAMDSTGTVEVLLVTNDAPILSKEMLQSSICFWPHVKKGEYCACGQILTAGAAFQWFREVLGEKDAILAAEQNRDTYDVITSKFQEMPSSLLFVPHLSGSGTPEFNPNAKAALYGATLNTNKYDIAKSVLEGISFELKINTDLLEDAGIRIDTLRALGGAANSKTWMQIKADITGKMIEACQMKDQCPLGAAILAAYGIGMINDLSETTDFVKREYKVYEPEEKNQSVYRKKFYDYLKFRQKIFGLYEEIGA